MKQNGESPTELEPTVREPVPQDGAVLREMAATVARASGASKVILFGSVARGEAGPDSDLDLLLLLEDAHYGPGATLFELVEPAIRADVALGPRTWSLDLVPMRLGHYERGESVLARVVRREGVTLFIAPSHGSEEPSG